MGRPATESDAPAPEACRRPRGRLLAAVLAVAAVVLTAGCRVDLVVDIDVGADGSGEVAVEAVFDEEVLRWVPDLGELIVTDDLVGWDVRRFDERTTAGERLRVVAVKGFDSPAEMAAVLSEIDRPAHGGSGLFRSATFTGSRDGARVLYDLVVTVGLDRPVAGLVNPATADALEGELFGLPIAEIEERAGAPLDQLVTLVVRATVPEGAAILPAEGVMTLNEGGTRELRVSGEVIDVEIVAADAEAERLEQRAIRGTRIAIIWGTAVAVIGALLWILAVRSRNRRRRAPGYSQFRDPRR